MSADPGFRMSGTRVNGLPSHDAALDDVCLALDVVTRWAADSSRGAVPLRWVWMSVSWPCPMGKSWCFAAIAFSAKVEFPLL